MIVLHAGVEGETLLLWGETPAEVESSSKSRPRKAKTARDEALPFGAGARGRPRVSQAMPAAGRALPRAEDAPPQKAAADVLSVFVGRVVDYLVRVSLLPQEAVIRPGRRLLKTTFASVHDQWLHALAM